MYDYLIMSTALVCEIVATGRDGGLVRFSRLLSAAQKYDSVSSFVDVKLSRLCVQRSC